MSYQALARKWRPQMFAQLMGQEHVVTALSNALSNDRLHHAYLFTGTRGVGKTTIARIFAKSLNCENGVTAEPCGQCQHCVAIEEGRFVDLVEVDAASRTKVEDTREILDNVQYKPTQGRYKVYLIDEVHMLSRHSFNALLKTLEEPPPHIKFLLATTDPQKLPVTILSRCLQFSLKAMTLSQIETQLDKILNAENIAFEQPALALLAKAANGSMRDSLSLTDQAVAQGNGQLKEANVRNMLGLLDEQHTAKLVSAIVDNDFASAMQAIEDLSQAAVDAEQVLVELMNAFHQIALIQSLPDYAKLNEKLADILTLAANNLPDEQVQLYYQICLRGRRDLPYAAHPRAGLEMTMMRLFAFNPVSIDRAEVFSAKKQLNKSDNPASSNSLLTEQSEGKTALDKADLTEQSQQAAVSVQNVEQVAEQIETELESKSEAISEFRHGETADSTSQVEAEPAHIDSDTLPTTQPDSSIEAANSSSADLASTDEPDSVDSKPLDLDVEQTSEQLVELNAQQAQILSLAESQLKPNSETQTLSESAPHIEIEQVSVDIETTDISTEPAIDSVADSIELATQENNIAVQNNSADEFSVPADYQAYEQQNSQYDDSDYADYQNFAAGYDPEQTTETQHLTHQTIAEQNDEPISADISDMLSSIRQTKAGKKEEQNKTIQTDEFDPNIVHALAQQASELVVEHKAENSQQNYQPDHTQSLEQDTPPWHAEQQTEQTNNQLNPAEQAQTLTEWQATAEQAQLDRQARQNSTEFANLNINQKVHQGIRKAHQFDDWAELIEQLELSGLQRQFALHSTYQLNNNQVNLRLSESQKHLNTQHNCQILKQKLAAVLNQNIEINVEIADKLEATPYQIQQEIEDCRLVYANELIDSDTQVNALLAQFDGQIVSGSIKAV
ncbi:DNA polymerase III subunit gamma/tau [Catenovulum sp. 2E275]|uniref:DNA polymerase III subunit gamma/tau n=1 Tax=Catenovulum sp. 2E275 TaxID=2980497 RepID=UPI0021D02131|nr:DNA polymerase III subunit gamma/tau [Catenovulum sp. 2E275]MCU4674978.1 DNA polymerase III subunit gamma/tau [Catenovulum sp. 2E275]